MTSHLLEMMWSEFLDNAWLLVPSEQFAARE
jgi:hypothetical protein